jgi:uncharacterized protein GlcG (DUF336 family)
MMSSIARRSIDAATAQKAIEAAVAKARATSRVMSIVVVDDAGHVKASLRMDGAPALTLQIATDKAFTAATFGAPTHSVWDFVKNDPPLLHSLTHYPRVMTFGGGYPIREGDALIGAIGLSGGHYSEDMECARAALEAIGAPVA